MTRAGGRSAFSSMATSSRLASLRLARQLLLQRVGAARGDRQPIKLPRGKFETVGPRVRSSKTWFFSSTRSVVPCWNDLAPWLWASEAGE